MKLVEGVQRAREIREQGFLRRLRHFTIAPGKRMQQRRDAFGRNGAAVPRSQIIEHLLLEVAEPQAAEAGRAGAACAERNMPSRKLGPAAEQLNGKDYGRPAGHRWLDRILIALALSGAAPVPAQESYPEKPVRIIVPFPAGGAVDPLVRALAHGMSERIGQSVLVENRPGATGTIGMSACAKAAPDGYTLCFVTSDGISVIPHLRTNLPFDAERDFAPVTLLGYANPVLVANARSPFNSFAEMIAYARAHPGKINFGTFGEGGISHQLLEAIKQGSGTQFTNVPYKGTGPAIQAAVAGEVDLALSILPVVSPHMKAGKLKPVAVLARERLALLPDVPTYKEQGFPVDVVSWFGIMAPAATPRPILSRVHEEIAATMAKPQWREKFMPPLAYEVLGDGPEEFSRFIRSDRPAGKAIAELLRAAGFRPD